MYLGRGDRTRFLAKRIHFPTSVKMKRKDRRIEDFCVPHSARNGREKTIRKQEQGANNSVGRQEKRNLKYEGEEETN